MKSPSVGSYISNDEFVSVNGVLKEYSDTWKKQPKTLVALIKAMYKYGWYNNRNINFRKRVYW